jgi:hypothetical protein
MECDDSYVIDANGERVLIGLTTDETREFERLDELIMSLVPEPTDELRSRNERRWLALYDKHDAAVRSYITNENAKALRALRWDWTCKN